MDKQFQLDVVQYRIQDTERKLKETRKDNVATNRVKGELETLLSALKTVRHELLVRNEVFRPD